MTVSQIRPFGSVERVFMALLVQDFDRLGGSDLRIGGDFPVDGVASWYIRIGKVPGGRSTAQEGNFLIDIDVFSKDYLLAEKISLEVEALLLGRGWHSAPVDGHLWVIDDVYQNTGPAELPWVGDDEITRMGSSYAVTIRRR